MSLPLDKDEAQRIIKSVLATFTTQYTKHYTLTLAEVKEREILEDLSPKYKLKEREVLTEPSRPSDQSTQESKEDLKAGYLTKEGGLRKTWKKRWFIVRHDYTVEYYSDEKVSNPACHIDSSTLL